jgi:uncharacterized protein (UPF0276 family)
MKFGLNYSHTARRLLDAGEIAPDVFKCPAWPDLLAQLQGRYPHYVHFPLGVGAGRGIVLDGETKAPVQWERVERLLAMTGTPYLNLHLLSPAELEGIDTGHVDPLDADQALEALIRDVEGVVERFGRDRVIVENAFNLGPDPLHAAFYPEVIRGVVEATGCGFLFDLSHARLAALRLEMDYREYIARLPMHAVREIHITGIQVVDATWLARAQASGMTLAMIESYIGPGGAWLPQGMTDHLPLSEEDWPVMAWAAGQIRSGAWAEPWVVTLECGGVGLFWEATFTEEEMRAQVPRLQRIFQG